MFRHLVAITCVAALGFATGTTAYAEDATPKPVVKQTECPGMGGAVDTKLFVDHDGKRIYVCCGGCINVIKKDPAKYIKQLEAQGITLDRTPAPADAAGAKKVEDPKPAETKSPEAATPKP